MEGKQDEVETELSGVEPLKYSSWMNVIRPFDTGEQSGSNWNYVLRV